MAKMSGFLLILTFLGSINLMEMSKIKMLNRKYRCLRSDGLNDNCQPFRFSDESPGVGLEICQLQCGTFGPLWPRPTGSVNLGSWTLAVDLNRISMQNKQKIQNNQIFPSMFEIFKTGLKRKFASAPFSVESGAGAGGGNGSGKGGNALLVEVEILNPQVEKLTLNTDESYILKTDCFSFAFAQIKIQASTAFGARNALETVGQLVALDRINETVRIACGVYIADAPVYPFRGLMLDTSRHFYSVQSIERLLDAMSMNKMNRFHWHLTDSQSQPIELNSWSNLTMYGAYSPDKIYTQREIRHLIQYARIRGIEVQED